MLPVGPNKRGVRTLEKARLQVPAGDSSDPLERPAVTTGRPVPLLLVNLTVKVPLTEPPSIVSRVAPVGAGKLKRNPNGNVTAISESASRGLSPENTTASPFEVSAGRKWGLTWVGRKKPVKYDPKP